MGLVYARQNNAVPLLWGSEAAHAELLYLSVITHFTLHFPSAAFYIPAHQEGEGGGAESRTARRGKCRKD